MESNHTTVRISKDTNFKISKELLNVEEALDIDITKGTLLSILFREIDSYELIDIIERGIDEN